MAGCNVELIAHHRICGAIPARPFTATCACGHKISGDICETCSVCRLPGCLTCWNAGLGHDCPATFDSAVCLCGCGKRVPIAQKKSSRDGHVKGRPIRYIPGHNTLLRHARNAS